MRATDEQILERVTVLLSTLPMRTTDQLGIKAALTAYSEALEGCDISDLRMVVTSMFAGRRKWAPSAPDLGQAVRDIAARRQNASKALEHSPEPEKDPPTGDEYDRMQEKWARARKAFDYRESAVEWRKSRLADGTIKRSAEIEASCESDDGQNPGVLPDGMRF